MINPSPSYPEVISLSKTEPSVELGLERLYSLGSIGIDEEEEYGTIDEEYIQRFHNSIQFTDGKYHVELPWYPGTLDAVPSNFKVALATLKKVKSRLTSQGLADAYGEVFKQQVQEGIIEPINVLPSDFHKYIWIPHRPIIKTAEQVTTKIRPVFNCSFKAGSAPSLNQACYPGVDLMVPLLRLLLSFRSNKYVILADISKAFLQIRLKLEEDRNCFCFFWEEDGKLLTYRYSSIIFGLAVSPYILGAVIRHHVKNYPPDLCSQLLSNNLYVDNLIFSHSSLETLQGVYKTAVERMQEGGFDLGSWNTNNPQLKNTIKREGKLVSHQCSEERVLGYLYDTTQDTMKLSDFELSSVSTKRDLLSEISKVFDPLSLYLPVSLRGRLLMRQTWAKEMKMKWDDPVGQDIKDSWEKIRVDLDLLKTISFPRSCFDTSASGLSLNIFCDASTLSYGFVVYASSSGVAPSILWSKSKVAPAKGRTLPCLELLSVYLALKCLPQLLASFAGTKFESLNIFSDSQITLAWIAGQGRKTKQIFARNRTQAILKMSSSLRAEYKIYPKFLYVRTEENPADLITRGLSFKDFEKRFLFWSKGPRWLEHDPTYWPKHSLSWESKPCTSVFVTLQVPPDLPVIDFTRFSSLSDLLRCFRRYFKFFSNWKLKKYNEVIDCDLKGRLYCLKRMQRECFPTELQFLERVQAGTDNGLPPDLVNRLNLFIDDFGLIRSKGRLGRTNHYSYEVINPIVLGKSHHFTRLMIQDVHFECQHLGLQATLTNIRLRGYWITSARQTIKKVMNDCIICKKYNNFAFRYPKFTNFSKAQVEFFSPFRHVGIDFTSHYFVKVKGATEAQKMYILVYTCMNIRAIHLDLLPDMSAKTVVQSLKRFVARFGPPEVIYSDNAKYFNLEKDAIEIFVSSDEGSAFLQKNRMQHKRIPLYSPWVGSMWERMIRTVKNCLKKVVGRAQLEYFEFITILADVANAVNNRPLTYTSSENDVLPLTPNDFLKPHSKTSLVLKDRTNDEPFWDSSEAAREDLVKSIKRASEKFEAFRTQWYNDYLLGLREVSRDLYQTSWKNLIRVGDVVLVKSPVRDRPYWQMGVVQRLIFGDDSKVRSAYIRMPDRRVDHHSISHLYPLELSVTHNGGRTSSNPDTESGGELAPVVSSRVPSPVPGPSGIQEEVNRPSERPVRQAAVLARAGFTQSDSDSEEEEADC